MSASLSAARRTSADESDRICGQPSDYVGQDIEEGAIAANVERAREGTRRLACVGVARLGLESEAADKTLEGWCSSTSLPYSLPASVRSCSLTTMFSRVSSLRPPPSSVRPPRPN